MHESCTYYCVVFYNFICEIKKLSLLYIYVSFLSPFGVAGLYSLSCRNVIISVARRNNNQLQNDATDNCIIYNLNLYDETRRNRFRTEIDHYYAT